MWSDWMSGAILAAVVAGVLLQAERLPGLWLRAATPVRRLRRRLVRRVLRRRRPVPVPRGRPLESIARDVTRLGVQFHDPGRVPFVKYEARRWAYDRALAEACEALEVTHLLAVLPPGFDLDAERERVERALRGTGLGAVA